MPTVHVKSHTRNGNKVNSYTRSAPAKNCTLKGIYNKSKEVYKKSNVKNPIKTGNKVIDFAIGRQPLAKKWNLGFNIGKYFAITKNIYDETCKNNK